MTQPRSWKSPVSTRLLEVCLRSDYGYLQGLEGSDLIWRREEAGEVYIVTLLYKDVLISYAVLRALNPKALEANKRARVVETASRETISRFTMADRL